MQHIICKSDGTENISIFTYSQESRPKPSNRTRFPCSFFTTAVWSDSFDISSALVVVEDVGGGGWCDEFTSAAGEIFSFAEMSVVG